MSFNWKRQKLKFNMCKTSIFVFFLVIFKSVLILSVLAIVVEKRIFMGILIWYKFKLKMKLFLQFLLFFHKLV